jgi:hypothetical protein
MSSGSQGRLGIILEDYHEGHEEHEGKKEKQKELKAKR